MKLVINYICNLIINKNVLVQKKNYIPRLRIIQTSFIKLNLIFFSKKILLFFLPLISPLIDVNYVAHTV